MILKTNRNISLFMVVVILVWAVTVGWYRDTARLAEGLLILASVLCAKDLYQQDKRPFVLWLLGAGVIFSILMACVNHWAAGQYDPSLNHDRFSRFYIKLLLFIPIGGWLLIQKQAVYWMVAALALGIAISALFDSPTEDWSKMTIHSRMALGFGNAQHAAMYGGSLLLVALCMLPGTGRLNHLWGRWLARLGLLVLVLMGVLIVILTKTRGVWLGLIAALPIGAFFFIKSMPYFRRQHSWVSVAASVLLSVLITGSLLQLDMFSQRLKAELEVHQQVLQGELDNLPLGSTGIRLKQWGLAVELMKKRPLLGYGGDTKTLLIAESTLPKRAKNNFGHFHNSYLDLGVAYGVLAIGFFMAIMMYLMVRSLRYLGSPGAHSAFACLGLTWAVFFIITNGFESYVMYRTGYSLLGIVGGIIFALTSEHRSVVPPAVPSVKASKP
ncbi:O-antigen ligase family protein [bacterium]|nr:O-antigen ligase family protein [bacterium]